MRCNRVVVSRPENSVRFVMEFETKISLDLVVWSEIFQF